MSHVVITNQNRFEAEVLKSDVPVVVDFWAPWCGPCRMMAPVLESLAGTLSGSMKFAKVDTDENGDLARDYRIMAIPTLIVFKAGKEIDRLVGFAPQSELESRFRGHLPAAAVPGS